jgi:DnaK suppressor protein
MAENDEAMAAAQGRKSGDKLRAHADAGLSEPQLEELHELLIEKQRELETVLEKLNRKIVAKEDCSLTDAAEAASLREEAARASGIAAQHEQTLVEIDDAVSRLRDGRYGLCERSGEPIGIDRLRLIPWARTRAEN